MKPHVPLYVSATALILLGYLVSLGLRWESMSLQTGAQGLESSYHALLTMKALAASPPGAHLYLPTVTLSPYAGNPLAWGGRYATAGGSYIYTSFPPLGFLIPYAVLRLVSAPFELLPLALFNSLVGLVAAIGMGSLCAAVARWSLVRDAGRDRLIWAVFLCTSLIYMFLREALVSHGSVYWPHSISQLCLIYGLILSFRILRGAAGRRDSFALLALCLIYPLLEWTGYLFNIGLALGLVAHGAHLGRQRFSFRQLISVIGGMPLALAAVTTFAGCATLLHFSLGIGFEHTLLSLGNRAAFRTGGESLLLSLPRDYLLSFAGLLPTAAVALVYGISQRWFRLASPLTLLLFIASFPMVENVIMRQHADAFSFDRLKFAVPLLLLVSAACLRLEQDQRLKAVVFATLIAVSSNIWIFRADQEHYRAWGEAVTRNEALFDRFETDPLAACSLYGASHAVKGYLNTLFARDIYDTATVPLLRRYAQDSCGLVLIHTTDVFTDLPRLTLIQVFDTTGTLLRSYPAL